MVSSPPRRSRLIRSAALVVLLLVALPVSPAAHEIPADVTVHAFLRPDGDVLRLLVRVPLTSMRDVDFPVRGPGYLDLEATRPLLADQARLWIADYVSIRAGGSDLGPGEVAAVRVSLPSSPAFRSWTAAREHLAGPPLPATVDLVPEQALLDVELVYPLAGAVGADAAGADPGGAGEDVVIDPRWAHLGVRTQTVLRFVTPGGDERVYRYAGDPGPVRLDPGVLHAAGTFTRMGFVHILGGIDHLLFILCLVIPLRSLAALVPVVTAFTVAHSITLLASAFGMAPDALWFPPLIEALIALSILWMACENMLGVRSERRWLWAFGFGLVHGFGFSFALRESLQFAGRHLVTSLLAFNVGVELGQVAVLAVLVPALGWALRRVPERAGVLLLSALVAHTAWHWTTERGAAFLSYDLTLPALDAALMAALLRWLMLALVAVGAAWVLSALVERWRPAAGRGDGAGAHPPVGEGATGV